jgi:hypothetical protein
MLLDKLEGCISFYSYEMHKLIFEMQSQFLLLKQMTTPRRINTMPEYVPIDAYSHELVSPTTTPLKCQYIATEKASKGTYTLVVSVSRPKADW